MLFVQNSRLDELCGHQEVLVNIMQKILQVSIDSSLGINSGLLTGKKVIKLNDSNRNCFVFLCLDH